MRYQLLIALLTFWLFASACEKKQQSAATEQPQRDPMGSIYTAAADAKREIADAVARASREHKRVLLDFGADWCLDCHVLDYFLEDASVKPLLDSGFIVVHVDVEEYNHNLDIAREYQVPLQRGVPAIAVLDSDGKLLYAAQAGEFAKARSMQATDVAAFLQRWKPQM